MKHSFVPTHYYRTLGSHDPVLRVSDGDQIFTTTVDARVFDHERNAVTQLGNPQTGPFLVYCIVFRPARSWPTLL